MPDKQRINAPTLALLLRYTGQVLRRSLPLKEKPKAKELSPAARVALWNAAVALLEQNSSLGVQGDVLPTTSPDALQTARLVKGA